MCSWPQRRCTSDRDSAATAMHMKGRGGAESRGRQRRMGVAVRGGQKGMAATSQELVGSTRLLVSCGGGV